MAQSVTRVLPRGALAYIEGQWLKAASGGSFDVLNPFNASLITSVPNCDVSDAQTVVATYAAQPSGKAISAARKALPGWSEGTTARQRAAILSKWASLIEQNKEDLARLLTLEQDEMKYFKGKPLAEAKGELDYSLSFLDWYSGEARRIYGQIVPAPVLNRDHHHVREPIGVVALITPWNFPTAMLARKAAAALAVGCTLVVKPAEDTPLSALAFASISQQAGLPPGVINILPADRQNTQKIGKFLCESEEIDAISFTGSTAVGKILLSNSASTVKRVCLELGGNAPAIVFPSANLDVAVKGVVGAKFRGTGQVCVSANRIFVHSSIAGEFIKRMREALKNFKIGNGLEEGITQGPLINGKAVEKVVELVSDAVKKGAKIESGGKRLQGNLYEPTLLTGINNSMLITKQEIFGPVAAIQTFQDEQQVIKEANNTRSGLAGYVFSTDAAQIRRVTRNLKVGMIGVNEGVFSAAEAAFGGYKESGLGREGGPQGIDEFTQWKYICTQY